MPNTTHPPPPPSSVSLVKSRTAHPDHKWLQPVLDHKHCPPFLVSTNSSMTPFLVYTIPDDVQQVLQVQHKHHPPVYIGIDSNGDLQVAAKAPRDLVTMSVIMPSDWSPPPSLHYPPALLPHHQPWGPSGPPPAILVAMFWPDPLGSVGPC